MRSNGPSYRTVAMFLMLLGPAPVLAGAAGALDQGVAPLQVSLRVAQDAVSTALDSIALVASVTSGGQPIRGANVTFNDDHNAAFNNTGSGATTNSSGVAVSTITLVSPFPGNDTITARASAAGYSSAKGTAVVLVLPFSIQQLAVTAKVTNSGASGGSSEVVQGHVGTVDSSSSNVIANVGAFWNPAITGVARATVVLNDTLGSTFSSRTVTTDSQGFYSVNFTLANPAATVEDILTASVSERYFNGSESSVAFAVNPSSGKALTVSLDSFYPSISSTILDSATIQARVSAGGSPAAGVPVTFSDSLSSVFEGPTTTTDASGTATTVVYFYSRGTGLDLFTARAAVNGSESGAGSNTLSVTPDASDQLSVSEQLSPANPAPGTVERVAGKVGWVGVGTMYLWSPTQTATPGAIVVISDSLKTFAPLTVSADSTGTFSANFTVPDTGGKPDIIVAAATSGGYKGSASSLFILPKPSQAPAGTAASSSSSSASSPSTESSSEPQSTTVSSSSASQSTGSSPPSDQTGILLVVGGIAVLSLSVYVVARVGRGSKR